MRNRRYHHLSSDAIESDMEQERQRVFQRKVFEDQFRALEQQEMQELLNIPLDGSSGNSLQHLAVSAACAAGVAPARKHQSCQKARKERHGLL